MRGYAATSFLVPAHVEVRDRVAAWVAALPEPWPVEAVRCHELARAVAAALGPGPWGTVQVVDGHFGSVDHSWLWLELPQLGGFGLRRHSILDPYAVGRLPMVQLVDPHPWPCYIGELYRPGPLRTDIDEAQVTALTMALMKEDDT